MARPGAATVPIVALAMATGIAGARSAPAQDISLNYESLSSLEEPIATEVGDVTIVLTGLVDASLIRDTGAVDDTDAGLVANFEIAGLTQLPNRWRVGVTYFGQHAAGEPSEVDREDRYTDNAAVSVGGMWGTVLGGDISGIVREQTRRARGAGNASLAFDAALGELAERGGGYTGRFGPWVVGAVADKDGNFDAGATYQRPVGDKDYRLTLRATRGVYTAADRSRRFAARAGGIVAEVIHGSTSFDAGVGLERFSSNGPDADRWYVSAGVRRKAGMVSLSLEGHFGRIEDRDEVSIAFGLQYDLARGLSANLGLSHAESRLVLDGTRFVDTRDTRGVVSLRYSF